MNKDQLMDYVIIPALTSIKAFTPASANLVFGTACVESNCGEYIHQINGPALGIFQMEPATHDDIWNNFIKHRKILEGNLMNACNFSKYPVSRELITNLRYAAIMCRIHYLRVPEALPPHDDVEKMAIYWKKYYNTNQGKGKVEHFINKYGAL